MISIIVPAHNEEAVIGRCLTHITKGIYPGDMEIIVVCNGCTDGTAQIARLFSSHVTVLEIGVTSKTAALNAGDAKATGFPRFYVDADVVLEAQCVLEIGEVLDRGNTLVAAPRVAFNCNERKWTIRAYYRIWAQLPYIKTNMIGTGVYALSREGRMRFSDFPPIIADDEFVRLHFTPQERKCVGTCSFTVFAPTRLSGLIKIMSRSRLGRLQLRSVYPDLAERLQEQHGRAIWTLLFRRPSLWPDAVVYAMVALLARSLARRRFKRSEFEIWDRDDSARQDGLRKNEYAYKNTGSLYDPTTRSVAYLQRADDGSSNSTHASKETTSRCLSRSQDR